MEVPAVPCSPGALDCFVFVRACVPCVPCVSCVCGRERRGRGGRGGGDAERGLFFSENRVTARTQTSETTKLRPRDIINYFLRYIFCLQTRYRLTRKYAEDTKYSMAITIFPVFYLRFCYASLYHFSASNISLEGCERLNRNRTKATEVS